MNRRKAKTPSALRVLCGELEDMIMWVRERLEPAVAEAEELAELEKSYAETMKDVYFEGLRRARKALKDCDTVRAEATIDAAMSFHPMHAESWPGWLGEKTEDAP